VATGNCWSRPTASWPPGIGRTPPAGLPPPCHSYAEAWEHAFNALAQLVAGEATTVPPSALAAAAQEALGSRKIALAGPILHPSQQPLMLDAKPEIFFAGSEACPFCAVQRWGLIVALGQFGTFRTFT